MARFLPTETLPAAPHVLAQGTATGHPQCHGQGRVRAGGGGGGGETKKQTKKTRLVWLAPFSRDTELSGCDAPPATAGGCDTRRHTRTRADRERRAG